MKLRDMIASLLLISFVILIEQTKTIIAQDQDDEINRASPALRTAVSGAVFRGADLHSALRPALARWAHTVAAHAQRQQRQKSANSSAITIDDGDELAAADSALATQIEAELAALDSARVKAYNRAVKASSGSSGSSATTDESGLSAWSFGASEPLAVLVVDARTQRRVSRFGGAEYVTRLGAASGFLAAIGARRMFAAARVPLDTPLGALVPWWTERQADRRSRVTLRHALGFRSGFASRRCECERFGVAAPRSVELCARAVYDSGLVREPGAALDFGPVHLLLVALALAHTNAYRGEAWAALYDRFVTAHLRAVAGTVDVPLGWTMHAERPMLAAGVSTNARVVADLLAQTMTNRSFLPQAELDDLLRFGNASAEPTTPTADLALLFAGARTRQFDFGLGAWLTGGNASSNGTLLALGEFGFYAAFDRDLQCVVVLAQNIAETTTSGAAAFAVLVFMLLVCVAGLGSAYYIYRRRRIFLRGHELD